MSNNYSDILRNQITKKEKPDKSEGLLYDLIVEGSKILKENRRVKENKVGRLYSSESGHCARKGVLYALEKSDKINQPTFPYYTEIGKVVELEIIKSLYNQQVLLFPNIKNLDEQYSIPDIGLNLGGKLDGVLYINNKIVLLEIKTAGQKMPTVINEKPQHLAQVKLYSAILGCDYELLYFSRNVSSDLSGESLKIKEFYNKFDRANVYDTVFNAAISSYCVQNNFLPPLENNFTINNRRTLCSYCDYQKNCWEGVNNNHEFIIPSEHQIRVMREYAHNFTGNLLKPESIKDRRAKFIDEISKVANTNVNNFGGV